jgi:hypothetical protein
MLLNSTSQMPNSSTIVDIITSTAISTSTSVIVPNSNINSNDQCNYNLLFSHLPQTFQSLDLNHFQIQLTPQLYGQKNQNNQQQQQLIIDSQFKYQQQLTFKFCFSIACLLFGLFYALIGYRLLKLSTFIIGFGLGSSIIYVILSEQKQLTLVENLIISLSIGVLFAFVALLVQYIGLFLLGVTSSITVVTFILVLVDLFYTNKSAWLCIGLLFICATIVASLTLRFQRSFGILNTSSIGASLLLISLDFFAENNLLIDYILELYRVNGDSFNMFERQRALLKSKDDFRFFNTFTTTTATTTSTSMTIRSRFTTISSNGTSGINNEGSSPSQTALGLFLHLYSSAHARLCWYTWAIFGSYFVFLFISLLIQFSCTGKNYDHRDSWHRRKLNFLIHKKFSEKC